MTLDEFIKTYDREDAFVLLEGKRSVTEEDRPKLVALGKLLATVSRKMMFRSGNAEGADQLFSEGVVMVDNKRLQLILPYSGHRKKANQAYSSVSMDEINIANEPEVLYHSKSNRKTENLIDQFVSGKVNRYSVKAAYILRDTVKVIGTNKIMPAAFGIFYDDLQKPGSGGTGHTMNVCKQNNIPFIGQSVWFKWLKE